MRRQTGSLAQITPPTELPNNQPIANAGRFTKFRKRNVFRLHLGKLLQLADQRITKRIFKCKPRIEPRIGQEGFEVEWDEGQKRLHAPMGGWLRVAGRLSGGIVWHSVN
jgi:hypothetical protein